MNQKIAGELKRIASLLIVAEEDKDLDKINMLKAQADALRKQFEDANKAAEELRKEYEEKKKEMEKQLKDAYKEFDRLTGYSDVVDQLTKEVKAYADTGKTLENYSDLIVRYSEKPAYKPQLDIALSLLNEDTYKKYKEILGDSNKIVVEYKTGMGILDAKYADWQQKTKDIYEERGMKLPKASLREASLKDVLGNIANFVNGIFGSIVTTFKNLIKDSKKNVNDLEKLNDKLKKAKK